MQEESSQEFWIGTHRVRIEPPDMMHFIWSGNFTKDEMVAISRLIAEIEAPRVFVLNDLTRSGFPDAGARQYMVRDETMRKIHATANIGASFAQRAMMKMIHRVVPIFLPGYRSPVMFASTEAEARSWLCAQRERLAASNTKA